MSEDPTYNPFADGHAHDRPTTSQGFYTSAFLPSLADLRRRPSPFQEDPDSEHGGQQRKGHHLRSRSEIQIVPPNSAGLHPLKSALFATISDHARSDDTQVTRPNLSRIVSEGQNSTSQEEEVGASSTNDVDVIEEKDVILHQVTPKDSLAGVSLKYGITLANLRRANQLWTSDSIHRRSVLYIPIEAASRAREYTQETELTLTPPDAPEEVTSLFDSTHSSPSSFNGDKMDAGLTKPSINVVRVPANQLTYFPPSSTKNLETRSRHSLDNPSPTLASGSRISPASSSKYDPTLPNHSLTSILTALPIAASTRDEIITRLSFDSASSGYSDTSRGSPNEENGHELGEVRKPGRGRMDKLMVFASEEGDADDMSMPTPKARPRKNSLPPSPTTATRQTPRAPGPGSVPKSSHIRSVSSCSPPQFYVSQPHETFVRTLQLEPSPAMQIPLRRSSTLGSAAGKKLQATFGVELQPRIGKDKKGTRDIGLHSLVGSMKHQP